VFPFNDWISNYLGGTLDSLATAKIVSDQLVLLSGQLESFGLKAIWVFEQEIKESKNCAHRWERTKTE
jgi:hypothetical protein